MSAIHAKIASIPSYLLPTTSSQWPSTHDINRTIKSFTFRLASSLTTPICKSHELFRRLYIVRELHPTASKASLFVRKFFFCLGILSCSFFAIFTSPPGVLLRALACHLEKEPFIHCRGTADRKVLPSDRSFTLLTWNVCCIGGGYAISDGGVLSWPFRIENIVLKILEQKADIICLYETFDVESAFIICEKLKEKDYTDFYFNIGPQVVGISSGMFVASKYAIENPQFTRFPQDALYGRAKLTGRGVFAFDLLSEKVHFAKIYTTHLQHSEEPQIPKEGEINARQKEMDIIRQTIAEEEARCTIVTGDLNMTDEECSAHNKDNFFLKNDLFGNQKTWGGDEYCALMVDKRPSEPLNLDHTMIVRNSEFSTIKEFTTHIVEVGYDRSKIREEALSDHHALITKVTLPNEQLSWDSLPF